MELGSLNNLAQLAECPIIFLKSQSKLLYCSHCGTALILYTELYLLYCSTKHSFYNILKNIIVWRKEYKEYFSASIVKETVSLKFSYFFNGSIYAVRKAIQISFRDITWNVKESMIIHEIFRVLSSFPATFHVISRRVNFLWFMGMFFKGFEVVSRQFV